MTQRHVAFALTGIAFALLAADSAAAQTGDAARPAAEARLPGLLVATDGLFRVPTAYLQRDGGLTAFAVGDRVASGGALAGFGQRLELGAAEGSGNAAGKFVGSAKVNLLPEALIAPAVSVGVLDAFGATRDRRSGYVVVSKYVIPYFVEALTGRQDISLKFHAGYGGGLYRNRPFVGAEAWDDKGVGALAEVAAGRVSVGVRGYRNGVGATVGLLDGKRVGGGLSYTISLR